MQNINTNDFLSFDIQKDIHREALKELNDKILLIETDITSIKTKQHSIYSTIK